MPVMISTRSMGLDIGVYLGLHLGPHGCARCPVELGAGPYGDPQTTDFFTEKATPRGGTKIVFEADRRKEAFAREIIPRLNTSYFEVLRPIFQRVTSIIEGRPPT